MIRGWDQSHDGTFYGYVFDTAYNDRVELIFDPDKQTLTIVGADEGVKLNPNGVENLRKKLQQVERYLKDTTKE